MAYNHRQRSQINFKDVQKLFGEIKMKKKIFFAKIFSFFDPIFDRRASFKGMKHVTHKSAQAILGIKLFVGPRATILAILNVCDRLR